MDGLIAPAISFEHGLYDSIKCGRRAASMAAIALLVEPSVSWRWQLANTVKPNVGAERKETALLSDSDNFPAGSGPVH